ncbi:hypothetical protein HMPREF9348_05123 [Escherichia coli MS 145-7]|nr:hypothetical protein HMPREF9348_05123 [Escherichia coli MS 145-7]
MSNWNIAAKSQEERNKVNVDLAARGGCLQRAIEHTRHSGTGSP